MVQKRVDILTELKRIEDAWLSYEKEQKIADILINPTERADEIKEWQKQTNALLKDLSPEQARLTRPDKHCAEVLGVRVRDLELEKD